MSDCNCNEDSHACGRSVSLYEDTSKSNDDSLQFIKPCTAYHISAPRTLERRGCGNIAVVSLVRNLLLIIHISLTSFL